MVMLSEPFVECVQGDLAGTNRKAPFMRRPGRSRYVDSGNGLKQAVSAVCVSENI